MVIVGELACRGPGRTVKQVLKPQRQASPAGQASPEARPRAEECIEAATPQEIFGRYLHAGALMRDADALFAEDGVFEAPLIPASHVFPSRLAGREAIRTAMAAYYQRSADGEPGRRRHGRRGTVGLRAAPHHRPRRVHRRDRDRLRRGRPDRDHVAGTDLPPARREDRAAAQLLRAGHGGLTLSRSRPHGRSPTRGKVSADRPVKVAQEPLGHSSIGLTADTYTSVSPQVAVEAAEAAATIVPRRAVADPGVSTP
jgi:hypothetical protein